MSHLVIVDGHAIAHRAYHSIPPLTVNGQPVNAIYGFYSMLLTALDTLKPKYLVICLDSPGPNFRNHEFLGYRSNRKPTDSELVVQLPELKNSIEQSTINSYAVSGYEADDLIATITKKALRKKYKNSKKHIISKVTIITGDKDLMQLVDPKVSLFVPIRGLSETKLFDTDAVKEKLGVNPSQVIDLKGLMGDASDNYPGVSGIGPKTATVLLEKYNNLENIYHNIDEIKPSIKLKLEVDRENAFLSKKLATLIDNVPVLFKLSNSKINKQEFKNLLNVFKTYNFRSLISRIEKGPLKENKIVINNSNQGSLF